MGASKEGAMSVQKRLSLSLEESCESEESSCSSSIILQDAVDPLSDKALERLHVLPAKSKVNNNRVDKDASSVGGKSLAGHVSSSPPFLSADLATKYVRSRMTTLREKRKAEDNYDPLAVEAEEKALLLKHFEKMMRLNEVAYRSLFEEAQSRIYQLEGTNEGDRKTYSNNMKLMQEKVLAHEEDAVGMKNKILDLERRLEEKTVPKDVEDRGTVMSPLPAHPSSNQLKQFDFHEDELFLPPKRRKLIATSNDTEPEFVAIPSSSTSILTKPSPLLPSGELYLGNHNMKPHRRSLSPPRLSPAVPPKTSTTLKSSLLGSGGKIIKLDQVEADANSEFPSDNFQQNELDRLDYLSHRQRIETGRISKFAPTSQRLITSSRSAFSPPSTLRPSPVSQNSEAKRRFINNFPCKSMNDPSNALPKTSPSVRPKGSTYSDISPAGLGENSHLISIRNNNFLKPQAKRHFPTPSQHQSPFSNNLLQSGSSDETSRQSLFRSLDAKSSAAATVGNESLTQDNRCNTEPVVKRKPGRPVGSKPRKRLPLPESDTALRRHSDTFNNTRLSNGVNEDIQSEPPPRFSKRGRLLKPNRQRYSPDPDSTHSREKFMSTRKNYYVSESFVPEDYSGSLAFGLDGDNSLGNADDVPRQGIDIEEEDTLGIQSLVSEKETETGTEPTEAAVETPGFRECIMEGWSSDEEKVPAADDDMSEEVFMKRHAKLEAQEKQRKRWDLQKLREESYKERMQRKEAERAKQKELRRQQRKRKGRNGITEEEEVVNPSSEDIKAIYVSDVLPVGAFGQTLPLNEKVDFHFCSGLTSSPPPLPSPTPAAATTNTIIRNVITDNVENFNASLTTSKTPEEGAIERSAEGVVCDTSSASTNTSSFQDSSTEEVNVVATLVKARNEDGETSSSSPPPLPVPFCSSPSSSSSLSYHSFPSPSLASQSFSSSTPPPPVIFCIGDTNHDVYEYTEEDDKVFPPELGDVKAFSTLQKKKNVSHDEDSGKEEECLGSISKDSDGNGDDEKDDKKDTGGNSPVIVSSSVQDDKFSQDLLSDTPTQTGSQPVSVKRIEDLNIIRLPLASSSAALPSTSPPTMTQTAGIKFFIPNNPLAKSRFSTSVLPKASVDLPHPSGDVPESHNSSAKLKDNECSKDKGS